MAIDFSSVYSPPGRPEAKFAQRQKPLSLWRHWRGPALLLSLAVSFVAQLPMSYDFASFVFYDPGVSLRTDLLIAQGYVPTIDFGYNYGLLPLMIGRAFFAAAGRTPAGYLLFMFLTEGLIAWGMWRLAARWHWPVIIFLVAAMPHAIIPVYLHLTHPLEAALIIHSIADLATGRRARALALATACIFVKPVMTFGLGLILLVWMARRAARQDKGWSAFAPSLLPAVLTGVACALASMAYFGFAPLRDTILPLVGAKSYEVLDFGLFGNGRTFWWPNLGGAAQYARYYLLTPAGFWILCTVLLAVFGVRALFALRHRLTAKHETLAAIAACHFFFLAAFYGWPGSWTYYSYLLVIGIGMGLTLFRARPALVLALALLALAGHTQTYKNAVNAWRHASRSPETAGLWAHADQRGEWAQVRSIAGGREIYYLNNGCPELLFPRVSGPVSFFLSPAMQTPREIELIRRQLEKADVVVTFNQGPILDPWYWDEFATQRATFVDTWRGTHLTIHERRR